MCNVAYIQMAQVVMGAIGQNSASKANERNARAAQQDSWGALNDQQVQLNAQASDQMVERSRQAMREAGTLNVIFADSGLAGATQDRLAAEAEGGALRDLDTMERNRINKVTQTQREKTSVAARTQSQVNSVPRPSLVGTGLQIAAIGAEDYTKRNPRTSTKTA